MHRAGPDDVPAIAAHVDRESAVGRFEPRAVLHWYAWMTVEQMEPAPSLDLPRRVRKSFGAPPQRVWRVAIDHHDTGEGACDNRDVHRDCEPCEEFVRGRQS